MGSNATQSGHPARPRGLAALLLASLLLATPGEAQTGDAPEATDSPAPVAPGQRTDADLEAEKEYWQSRYRGLLTEQARLREVIEVETELYADANRRNYRRGRKRHIHRDAMLAAKEELVKVEAELATIQEEARRKGALPGWFYEVEWQLEEEAESPAALGEDDDGRNPLYADEDDF